MFGTGDDSDRVLKLFYVRLCKTLRWLAKLAWRLWKCTYFERLPCINGCIQNWPVHSSDQDKTWPLELVQKGKKQLRDRTYDRNIEHHESPWYYEHLVAKCHELSMAEPLALFSPGYFANFALFCGWLAHEHAKRHDLMLRQSELGKGLKAFLAPTRSGSWFISSNGHCSWVLLSI